ncbi:MAG: hypothetical protein KDJ15_04735 [Alphaproteobacteria bacterium]|nr:hypothetical protein [Alphaproteobacteria bacterium]
MDEIAQRLKTTSESCITSYEAWEEDRKSNDRRESLIEAVHELRKVAARLEIEIAVSERNEMASKPIPIPPHRSARKRDYNAERDVNGNSAGHDEGRGNMRAPEGGPPVSRAPRRRRTVTRPAE